MRDKLVYTLFFISGFTALVFEVVWAKQACLIFGNTTLASAAVIAAFMTGLATGSHIFGKVADRRPDLGLFLYGCLEGGIAVFALLFPLLLKILTPLYGAIYARYHEDFVLISMIRFSLSFLILLFPTTLMGGTLPLLSRFLSRNAASMKEKIPKLYGMNLLGAMAGTFFSGYILIAWFGLTATATIAALLNVGIFVTVWRLWKRGGWEGGAPEPAPEPGADPFDRALSGKTLIAILLVMFAHGFVAFVVQICWTRVTALALGSSTYSFSAMLTTFLAGLGLGSFAVGLAIKKGVRFSLSLIGIMEIAVGVSVLAFIPVFEWLIYLFVVVFPYVFDSTFLVNSVKFLFCVFGMIVPTFIMGLLFPATLSFVGRPKDIGRVIGLTYAANTAGGVLGAFSAGFFMISGMGIHGSLRAVSILAVIVGFGVSLMGALPAARRSAMIKGVASTLVAVMLMFYPWDRSLYGSGMFIYAADWVGVARLGKETWQRAIRRNHDLLFYKDGVSSTITVLQYSAPGASRWMTAKSLRNNGKTDASTIGDMATQLYVGYVPMFAHPNPKEVMVIGLGSGVTLGAATQFREPNVIECVEIEPAIVEANRYFTIENNHALEDPRVKMIIGDGRNHIRFSSKKYDVIISEPTNPWISGVSSLFTTENYETALGKLTDEGVFCQWFHSYQMSLEDFIMIMQTFTDKFPHVNLFRVNDSDYFMLGSKKPIRFDYARMMDLIKTNRTVQADLKYFATHEQHFVLGAFYLSDADLRAALKKENKRKNTDDHLRLEYNAPNHLYENTHDSIVRWLSGIPRRQMFPDFYGWSFQQIVKSKDIWSVFLDKGFDSLSANDPADAVKQYKRAIYTGAPRESGAVFGLGQAYEGMKEFRRAAREYARLRSHKDFEVQAKSGIRRAVLGKRIFEEPILARDVEVQNLMAVLSYYMGDVKTAMRTIRNAINLDPTYVKNYASMAQFLASLGMTWDALQMLEKAHQYAPKDQFISEMKEVLEREFIERQSSLRLQQGVSHMSRGDFRRALEEFQEVVKEQPNSYLAHYFLSRAQESLGLADDATRSRTRSLELFQQYKAEAGDAGEAGATS